MVAPPTLGAGRPLFTGTPGRIGLEPLTARPFANGHVMLCYGLAEP